MPMSKKKKLYIILASVVASILLVVTIVLIIVANRDQSETIDEGNLTLVEERKNTPALEIYASLTKEEMPLAELEAAAREISQDITIAVYQNGIGQLEVNDQQGVIIFNYGHTDSDAAEDTSELEINSDDEIPTEEVVINSEEDFYADEPVAAIEYQPDETISALRYVYQIGDDYYSIGYSADSQDYVVFDLNELFEFETKKEAIEAYLSPVVRWRANDAQ